MRLKCKCAPTANKSEAAKTLGIVRCYNKMTNIYVHLFRFDFICTIIIIIIIIIIIADNNDSLEQAIQ